MVAKQGVVTIFTSSEFQDEISRQLKDFFSIDPILSTDL